MNEIKGKMGCDNDIVEHVFLVSFPGQGHVCWNKIRLTNITLRVGEIVGTINV